MCTLQVQLPHERQAPEDLPAPGHPRHQVRHQIRTRRPLRQDAGHPASRDPIKRNPTAACQETRRSGNAQLREHAPLSNMAAHGTSRSRDALLREHTAGIGSHSQGLPAAPREQRALGNTRGSGNAPHSGCAVLHSQGGECHLHIAPSLHRCFLLMLSSSAGAGTPSESRARPATPPRLEGRCFLLRSIRAAGGPCGV